MEKENVLTGYHFTSKRNWNLIQEEGMIPYSISKPELDKYFPRGVRGIWVWKERPQGRNEMGSVLYQMSTKQSHEIVLMQLTIASNSLLKYNQHVINLFHDGNIGDYIYHNGEPAVITKNPIPPENIQLVREYNVEDLITQKMEIDCDWCEGLGFRTESIEQDNGMGEIQQVECVLCKGSGKIIK